MDATTYANPETNAAFLALLTEQEQMHLRHTVEREALDFRQGQELEDWHARFHTLVNAHRGETIVLQQAAVTDLEQKDARP